MLIPLHLDNSEVRIFPWVCISIAAVCVVVHIGVSTSAPSDREVQARAEDLRDALEMNPEAAIPPPCAELFRARVKDPKRTQRVSYVERACDDLIKVALPRVYRKLGLVPKNGIQIGYVTSIFLHGGWGHLIGNMLFLYIVGPFLEDRWGRRFFIAFFLLAGIVSGATQALVDHTSSRPIVGASGAIAACMGAFVWLFYQRRVMVLAWFVLFIKRFYMPAWLWGGIWIGGEIFSYAMSGLDSPVAVLVHIGGFFFGLAVAVGAKKSGFDAKLEAAVDASVTVERADHAAFADAEAAFGRQDWARACAGYERVLRDEPKNPAVLYNGARAALYSGEQAKAGTWFERFLEICLNDRDKGGMLDAFVMLAPLGPANIRPALAQRAAVFIADDDPRVAAELFLRAASGGQAFAASAARAQQLFDRLRDDDGVARALAARGGGGAASASAPPPSVWTMVNKAALHANGVLLDERLVRFDEVLMLGAASVATWPCIDLTLHTRERFRLTPSAIEGLAEGKFDDKRLMSVLKVLLERTRAMPWPSRRDLVEGTWPRLDTIEELDRLVEAGADQRL